MVTRAERCETCRFWNDFDQSSTAPIEEHIGQCRRYPPSIQARITCDADDVDPGEGSWFQTEYNHWCGEWQPLAPQPTDAEKETM